MSQLLAPRNIVNTQKQTFNKEDKKNMQAWSGFTGFKLSEKTKVCRKCRPNSGNTQVLLTDGLTIRISRTKSYFRKAPSEC